MNAAQFCCNLISHYLKPSEVVFCAELLETDKKSVELLLKRRGRIDTSRYTSKRKRYMNPEIECVHCGEMIPINEENHVLAHCSASFASTPVPTKDREYIFMKLKRVRRMALHDYPP